MADRFVDRVTYAVVDQTPAYTVDDITAPCVTDGQEVAVVVVSAAQSVVAIGVPGPYFREYTDEFTLEFT